MFKVGDKPVPGYRLVRAIGRGQYGEVWETEAPGGARVALKFIPLQSKSGSVEVRAVQAVKRIRHANLIPVNAIWVLDTSGNVLDDGALNKLSAKPQHSLAVDQFKFTQDLAYLVIAMALADDSLEGILKERIEEGEQGIPRDELIEYMRQAAKGIDFLNEPRHEVDGKMVGITHRDVKPANLLLIGDSVVVGDFGVATTLKEFDATATNVVGSLGFMAPESIAQKPSPSTDQYALAITYYRLRTGGLPYDETVSVDKLIEIHRTGKLEFRGVPKEERTVLQIATAQKPTDRYENCSEFISALLDVANPKTVTSDSKTNLVLPIAIGTAIVALIAIFIWQPWNDKNNGVVENGKDEPVIKDNEKDADETGNGKKPIVPVIPKTSIRFQPDDVEFTVVVVTKDNIEGTPQIKVNSDEVQMAEDSKLLVSAGSPSPLYKSMTAQEFTYEQVTSTGKISLEERNNDEIRADVFAKIKNGESDAAIDVLKAVVEKRPEILKLEPTQLEIEGQVDKAEFATDESGQLVMAALSKANNDQGGSTKEITTLKHIDNITNELVATDAIGSGATGEFVEGLFYSTNSDRWVIFRSNSIFSWQPHQTNSFKTLWERINDENEQENNNSIVVCDLSSNGEWLVTGDNAGAIQILNIDTGGATLSKFEIDAHKNVPVAAVNFFGAGSKSSFISIDMDGAIKLCENYMAGEGNEKLTDLNLTTASEDEEFNSFAKIDNSSFAYATYGQLYRADIKGSTVILTKLDKLPDGAGLMRCSKSGNWLAVTTFEPSKALFVFDPKKPDNKLQFSTNQISTANDIAFSKDEKIMVIATNTGSLFAVELDTNDPRPIEISKFGSECKIVRFLPNTDTVCAIAVSDQEYKSTLQIWDIKQAIAFAKARTAQN